MDDAGIVTTSRTRRHRRGRPRPRPPAPTGVLLTGERRPAQLVWLRRRGAIILEDDYDAEYRYDRAAVGALQGSPRARPLRRLGERDAGARAAARLARRATACARRLHRREEDLADCGTAGIDQDAFAALLSRGELDRRLRRTRPGTAPPRQPCSPP